MTPHLFHSIVDGTMFLIADWTGKLTAAPEINVNVEFADLFIKRNILDVKRFFDSQRHFKKGLTEYPYYYTPSNRLTHYTKSERMLQHDTC